MATGERYTATVPDTLDLAERAGLALNALTGAADPDYNYECFDVTHLDQNPPYASRNGGGPCWPKQTHPLPMMRIMSGSMQRADYDAKMMAGVTSMIEDDGLLWLRAEGRPWDGDVYGGDITCTGSQSRFVISLLDWYKYDGNPEWLRLAEHLVNGLSKIAILSEDQQRAWYFYFKKRQGWNQDLGPSVDLLHQERKPSQVEPAFPEIYTIGQPLRAFARWYAQSGDPQAKEMADRVARFMLKAAEGENLPDWPSMIAGRQHGLWSGHFHSWTMGMIGLTEYAVISNNPAAKQFAQGFYEFARMQGIGRMGFFPAVIGSLEELRERVTKGYGEFPGQCCEACSIGDMIWIAVTLSEAGIGDYWQDIDQYVRNHLVEHQFTRRDYLEAMIAAGPTHVARPLIETDENVLDRAFGGFGSVSDPTWLLGWSTHCCLTNASAGMYKAWEAIIRPVADAVQVNLLLNRASPWMDVNSYLPYEGKVVLVNKTAQRAFVRLPSWSDKRAVQCRVNEQARTTHWLNGYLLIDGLAAGDVITIEFPMVESIEKHTAMSYGIEYTCHFKGNTLVDISPRGERPGRTVDIADDGDRFPVNVGYPMYERDAYKAGVAPMKSAQRYVAPKLI